LGWLVFLGGFIFIKIIRQTNHSKEAECRIPAPKKIATATETLRANPNSTGIGGIDAWCRQHNNEAIRVTRFIQSITLMSGFRILQNPLGLGFARKTFDVFGRSACDY